MNYDAHDYAPTEQSHNNSSMLWLWIPFLSILILGTVFSIAAYQQNDLTMMESIIAGFLGVGGLFIGLLAGFFGLIVGLLGGLIGLVVAGGAVTLTLFIIGSPIIALILLFLLTRRSNQCPDPSAHGEYHSD